MARDRRRTFPSGGPQAPRPSGASARPRPLAVLLRFALTLALLVALVLVLVLWTLPWLARRGSLNSIVESVIRESVHPELRVRIERIETDPLSRLAITSIEGIRTRGAEERFSFRCERASLLYNPVDLWRGRIEEIALARPEVFIDLDADPAELFEPPRAPPRAGPGDAEGFGIGHLSVERGAFTIRRGERELSARDVDVEVFGLGGRELLTFLVRARILGADIEAAGKLLPRPGRRYELREVGVTVVGLDVAPLLRVAAPGGALAGAGRIDLEGTLRGAWPDRIDVELRARAGGVSAGPAAPAGRDEPGGERIVRAADATFFLEAAVLDALARVEFALRAEAEGVVGAGALGASEREAVVVELAGAYDAADGGRVRLETPSRITARGLGTIDIEGEIHDVPERPRLELSARAEEIELAALGRRPFGSWLAPLARAGRGAVAIEAAVRGSPAAPRLEDVRLEARDVDLAAFSSVLGPAIALETIAGSASLDLRVPLIEPPAPPALVEADVAVRDLDLEVGGGAIGVDGGELSGGFALATSGGGAAPLELRIRGGLRLAAGGLALGPAWERLDQEPATVEGEVTLRPPRGTGEALGARVDLAVRLPSTGAVAARGELSAPVADLRPAAGTGDDARGPGVPERDALRLDLSVEAPSLPNRRFLATWLREPLEREIDLLAGAAFGGTSRLEARIAGALPRPRITGRFRTGDTTAELPALRLSVTGVAADLPFDLGGEAGPPAPPSPILSGEVAIGTLTVGGIGAGPIRIPLELAGRRYSLAGRVSSIPALGDALDLRRLEVDLDGEDARVALSLAVAALDLEPLAVAAGLPAIPGRIDADLEEITVVRDRAAVRGEMRVGAFGGEIALRDVTVLNWATPYATFSLGSGSVRDLDLLALGETFEIGVISGVLEGSIEDLVFMPGEVTRFEIDVETVERPGTPQFISTRAITSLKRVIAGPLAPVQDLFFSRFRYEGFGFTASLRRNRFRLRGKYEIDGVEHLMYGRWWQLPRIRIVNTRPGRDYDWKRIWGNVKSLFR